MPDPESTKNVIDWLAIGGKAAGIFAAFVSGIVSATWVIAKKVNGYDARIEALEKANGEITEKIDRKLDRLHQRVDEALLGKCSDVHYRHEQRGAD